MFHRQVFGDHWLLLMIFVKHPGKEKFFTKNQDTVSLACTNGHKYANIVVSNHSF
jgi:hypothetical protein